MGTELICPFCKLRMDALAKVCPHCTREIPKELSGDSAIINFGLKLGFFVAVAVFLFIKLSGASPLFVQFFEIFSIGNYAWIGELFVSFIAYVIVFSIFGAIHNLRAYFH